MIPFQPILSTCYCKFRLRVKYSPCLGARFCHVWASRFLLSQERSLKCMGIEKLMWKTIAVCFLRVSISFQADTLASSYFWREAAPSRYCLRVSVRLFWALGCRVWLFWASVPDAFKQTALGSRPKTDSRRPHTPWNFGWFGKARCESLPQYVLWKKSLRK